MPTPSATFHRLGPADVPLLRELNALFAAAFGDDATYGGAPPTGAYLEGLLMKEHVIAVAAVAGEAVLGGLVAYDLAVAAGHRRQRIATGLIEHLREIAARRGAWVIYVQADRGDAPVIALYEGLGTREDVLHFDIGVGPPADLPAPPDAVSA